MKKFILAAACVAALASCDVRRKDKMANAPATASAQTQQPAPPADPTSVQIIDSVYDFGKVAEGQVVEYSFRFKNSGDKPLVVTSASASCGCTVPEKPEQPVMPGQMGFIKVKFNSEGRPGEAHKTVTVISNARPEFPQLKIQGMVNAKNS